MYQVYLAEILSLLFSTFSHTSLYKRSVDVPQQEAAPTADHVAFPSLSLVYNQGNSIRRKDETALLDNAGWTSNIGTKFSGSISLFPR